VEAKALNVNFTFYILSKVCIERMMLHDNTVLQ